ncbi:MAG: hypothetical protein Q4F41_09745 [Eubacteriales bacterium]|nr:hypothetical protein [Eubacteriales bacterium]
MKRFTTVLCAAALTLGMGMSAVAAPSIGSLIPEKPVIVSGELPEGYTLAVQDADTESYENKDVADIVAKFNDDETEVSVKDVLDALKIDLTAEIKTESGTVIDPTEYDAVTPFVDLVITDGAKVEYTLDDKVKATLSVEVAKELEQDDLLIMQIDQKDGDVYFIELDEYVPETGEITAEFPCLGPFAVLEKSQEA